MGHETGITFQPLPDFFVSIRTVVVKPAQEFQKLRMPVSSVAFADHLAL
jgi:hypothetical protein